MELTPVVIGLGTGIIFIAVLSLAIASISSTATKTLMAKVVCLPHKTGLFGGVHTDECRYGLLDQDNRKYYGVVYNEKAETLFDAKLNRYSNDTFSVTGNITSPPPEEMKNYDIVGAITITSYSGSIHNERSDGYLKIISPLNDTKISGMAKFNIDYSLDYSFKSVATLALAVDGHILRAYTNNDPFETELDTTNFENGYHTIEVLALNRDRDVLYSDNVTVFINNPTFRTVDFPYSFNSETNMITLDGSKLAEILTAQTGFNFANDSQPTVGNIVGMSYSNDDNCRFWAQVKVHFYTEKDVTENKENANIRSVLPLNQSEIKLVDDTIRNFVAEADAIPPDQKSTEECRS